MTRKPSQVRIQLTGGVADLEAWKLELDEIAAERGFVQHFEDLKRFGDKGPLHKMVVGYVETIA